MSASDCPEGGEEDGDEFGGHYRRCTIAYPTQSMSRMVGTTA